MLVTRSIHPPQMLQVRYSNGVAIFTASADTITDHLQSSIVNEILPNSSSCSLDRGNNKHKITQSHLFGVAKRCCQVSSTCNRIMITICYPKSTSTKIPKLSGRLPDKPSCLAQPHKNLNQNSAVSTALKETVVRPSCWWILVIRGSGYQVGRPLSSSMVFPVFNRIRPRMRSALGESTALVGQAGAFKKLSVMAQAQARMCPILRT